MADEHMDPTAHYQDPAVASTYDANRFTSLSGRHGHRKEVRALERALGRTSGVHRALDVPCGTGRITKVLLNRGLEVTGADLSLAMIAEAKKNLQAYEGRVTFFEGDATKLHFPDDTFDLVTCVRLFGHVPGETRIQMLRELRRVSRRWVIVNYFDWNPLIRFKRWVKRDILKTYQGVAYPTTQKTMLSEFEHAGLRMDYLSFGDRYYSEEIYALTSKR